MLKRMRFAFLLFVILAPALANATPIISVGPYTPTTPIFTVPVDITGAVDLVTWQFDLAFDPADVQADFVTEGPFTSSSGQFLSLFIPGVIDNITGLISLVAGAYMDLPPGPSGDGVLANVEFTLLGNGESPITVENGSVIQGSSVPVPEPTTLVLFASGVVLLGIQRLVRGSRR